MAARTVVAIAAIFDDDTAIRVAFHESSSITIDERRSLNSHIGKSPHWNSSTGRAMAASARSWPDLWVVFAREEQLSIFVAQYCNPRYIYPRTEILHFAILKFGTDEDEAGGENPVSARG
jgi:hypothetical protein